MNITNFEDLLVAAALQPEQQRLLLTFTVAEPEPGVPIGGQARTTLVPVMCVDKQVGELDTFANLVSEAKQMGQDWDIMLVTTLSGTSTQLPDEKKTEAALSQMVNAIRDGRMAQFLAFDRSGELLQHA